MIQTKPFQPTPKELFFLRFWKSLFYIFVGFFIGIFIVYNTNPDSSIFTFPNSIYLSFYLATVAALGLFFRYKRLQKPAYKSLFIQREYIFTKDQIHIKGEADLEVKMPWTKVVRVEKRKHCYLLYFSKIQFHYIPFTIFQNSEDQKAFEKILEHHQLLSS